MSKKDIAESVQTVVNETQAKAKEALEKSSVFFGEANDFARANLEALVESGKIVTTGLQDLSSSFIADGRGKFEKLSADIKQLAAAKSPTEFLQLQSEIARKGFDDVVAYSSKSSEAWLKLASEAFTPLSNRVSQTVDKVRSYTA